MGLPNYLRDINRYVFVLSCVLEIITYQWIRAQSVVDIKKFEPIIE